MRRAVAPSEVVVLSGYVPISDFQVLLGFASDGIKQPRRLADVGRHKTSESVNRNQRKKDRVSELTWK